MIINSQ